MAVLAVILAVLFCAAAQAESGTWGDLAWTLTDSGELTITGSGEMQRYPKTAWLEYAEQIKTLTVGENIISLGEGAFSSCTNLTSASLPGSLTAIGDSAFYECSSLQESTYPNTLQSIGNHAFNGCSSLKKFVLPENVSIGWYAFKNCSSLEDFQIPESLGEIDERAFTDCPATRYATIGLAGAKALGKARITFRVSGYNCDIRYLYSSDEITDLAVISASKNDTEVIIPSGVTRIDDGAFNGCANLTKVTIPEGVTSLGYVCFADCTSLKNIQLPNSLKGIYKSVISGCSSLEEMVIPEGVSIIDEYAFTDCSSLKSVTIPQSVTTINYRAFNNCSSLASVTIPDGLTSIGGQVFAGGPDTILYATIGSEGAKTLGKAGYAFYVSGNPCKLIYYHELPTENIVYELAMIRMDKTATTADVPSGVTYIDTWAFSGCKALTEVIIPETVISIASSSGLFSSCDALKTVTIKAPIEDLHFAFLFNDCAALEAINYPSANPAYSSVDGVVLSKDGSKLVFCPRGKTGFAIPDTVTDINGSSFENCVNLSEVTIPESVESIHDNAFAGCTSLKSVRIPDSVFNFGENLFEKTTVIIANEGSEAAKWAAENGYTLELTQSDFTVTVTNDGNGTASVNPASGPSGTKVTLKAEPKAGFRLKEWKVISGGVTVTKNQFTIGSANVEIKAVFEPIVSGNVKLSLDKAKGTAKVTGPKNGKVTKITIPATYREEGVTYKVTEIAANAFKGYKNTTKITIGKNVKTIGKNAFSGCTGLKTVSGMASVATISDAAFKGCKALTSITLPASVTRIGKNAFNGCAKLAKIIIKTAKLTAKNVGSAAFKGTPKKAVFKCPAKQRKDYQSLLIKKGVSKTEAFK